MSQYYVRNLHENRPGNWIRFWEEQTGLNVIKLDAMPLLTMEPMYNSYLEIP